MHSVSEYAFYMSHPWFFPEPLCSEIPASMCDHAYRMVRYMPTATELLDNTMPSDWETRPDLFQRCGRVHPTTNTIVNPDVEELPLACNAISTPVPCPAEALAPPPVPPPALPQAQRFIMRRPTILTNMPFLHECDYVAWVASDVVAEVGVEQVCSHTLRGVWPVTEGSPRVGDPSTGLVTWVQSAARLETISYFFGINAPNGINGHTWAVGKYELCYALHPGEFPSSMTSCEHPLAPLASPFWLPLCSLDSLAFDSQRLVGPPAAGASMRNQPCGWTPSALDFTLNQSSYTLFAFQPSAPPMTPPVAPAAPAAPPSLTMPPAPPEPKAVDDPAQWPARQPRGSPTMVYIAVGVGAALLFGLLCGGMWRLYRRVEQLSCEKERLAHERRFAMHALDVACTSQPYAGSSGGAELAAYGALGDGHVSSVGAEAARDRHTPLSWSVRTEEEGNDANSSDGRGLALSNRNQDLRTSLRSCQFTSDTRGARASTPSSMTSGGPEFSEQTSRRLSTLLWDLLPGPSSRAVPDGAQALTGTPGPLTSRRVTSSHSAASGDSFGSSCPELGEILGPSQHPL